MARKQSKKAGMTPQAEPVTKPIRLDLTPELHRMLRRVAAGVDKSMAAFARDAVEATVLQEMKRQGLK